MVRPKTAKGQRIVPMVPWMASALESWRQAAPASPHQLVWSRPDGRPLTARTDTAAWKALQVEAGVAGPGRAYYGHEARHTTATLLLEAGVDPQVVQAILGIAQLLPAGAINTYPTRCPGEPWTHWSRNCEWPAEPAADAAQDPRSPCAFGEPSVARNPPRGRFLLLFAAEPVLGFQFRPARCVGRVRGAMARGTRTTNLRIYRSRVHRSSARSSSP